MRYIELSDEDYARLKAAADADGVSPVQWIVSQMIKRGLLSPDYRLESDPGEKPDPQPDSD